MPDLALRLVQLLIDGFGESVTDALVVGRLRFVVSQDVVVDGHKICSPSEVCQLQHSLVRSLRFVAEFVRIQCLDQSAILNSHEFS
jgi:hypothetical protein